MFWSKGTININFDFFRCFCLRDAGESRGRRFESEGFSHHQATGKQYLAVPFSRKFTSSLLDCRLAPLCICFFNRYQTFAVASISTPSIRVIFCNKGGHKSIYFRRRSTGQVIHTLISSHTHFNIKLAKETYVVVRLKRRVACVFVK